MRIYKNLFFSIFFYLSTTLSPARAELRVISTLPVFDSLVNTIGGDRVDHQSLALPGQDPHSVEAKPSFVTALARADILVDGGLGLEDGWLPVLVRQAANPGLTPGAPGRVHLSKGIKILEIPGASADRSQGDIHPQGNPHIWLDPRNLFVMAENLATTLSLQDPEGKAVFATNLSAFKQNLQRAIARWSSRLKPLAGSTIVTYHRSLSYFAGFAGITVLDTLEPLPGIPPSSSRLIELASTIQSGKVRVILGEAWYPIRDGKFLSEKTGVPVHRIPEGSGDVIADIEALVEILVSP